MLDRRRELEGVMEAHQMYELWPLVWENHVTGVAGLADTAYEVTKSCCVYHYVL